MDRRLLSVLVVLTAVIAVGIAGCTGSSAPAEETPSGAADQTGKEVYKVGIDIPYPPFSMIDDQGKATGFDVESMEWIAEDQGFEVEFEQIAWDGIIPALQAEKIDMIYSGMTITDERKEKVDFSKPYWTVNQAVVAKKDSGVTIDDLKAGKYAVGTQRGCTAAIWMEENLINEGIMAEDKLKSYDNTPLAVNDLESGRVQAVMYDSTVMRDIIDGKDNLEIIGYIETNEEFGIAIRKNEEELLTKLNAGLDNLMASDDWQKLIEKYKMK